MALSLPLCAVVCDTDDARLIKLLLIVLQPASQPASQGRCTLARSTLEHTLVQYRGTVAVRWTGVLDEHGGCECCKAPAVVATETNKSGSFDSTSSICDDDPEGL